MGQSVLVIGSVHIDIIARYARKDADRVDKIGRLRFGVGGAAFNVAANLALRGVHVAILTNIRRDSLVEAPIRAAIRAAKINDEFIERVEGAGESGFVGQFQDDELVSAVSCVAMESSRIEGSRLRDAVDKARLVVIEANLTASEIAGVSGVCKNLNKPLFALGVSDSKIARLADAAADGAKFTLVSMNMKERRALEAQFPRRADCDDGLCELLSAEEVVVTDRPNAIRIYRRSADAISLDVDRLDPALVRSTLGAGDALFAALCAAKLQSGDIDWSKTRDLIREYVHDVLRSETATPDRLKFSFDRRRLEDGGRAALALTLLVVAAIACALALFSNQSLAIAGVAALLLPIIAGSAGALVLDLFLTFVGRRRRMSADGVAMLVTLGGGAGFIAGLFHVLQHLSIRGFDELAAGSGDAAPPWVRGLALGTTGVGFVAGLGFELVLSELRRSRSSQDIR